jgi:Chromo (CHRromatin Organisation MOdifier) domain
VISSFSGTTLSITDIRARQLLNIEQLRDSIEGLHKAARDASETRRAKSRDHQHHRSGVKSPNFDIGDYVLIAKREFHAGEKLTLRWRGPRRIISALSDHVYEVQDLENGRIATVHSSRIRFYHDPSLNVTADLLQHIANTEQGYAVKAIQDIRFDAASNSFQVLVYWIGFDDEDATWEPLTTMHEDAPDVLDNFFQRCVKHDLVQRARHSLI